MKSQVNHEIDISGRLERKEHDTYLGFGGPCASYRVKLPIGEKEKLWPRLESIEVERSQVNRKSKKKKSKKRSLEDRRIRVFLILCYFLLRDAPAGVEVVIIDQDYPPKKLRAKKGLISKLLKENDAGPTGISTVIGRAGKGDAHWAARKGEVILNVTAELIAKHYK